MHFCFCTKSYISGMLKLERVIKMTKKAAVIVAEGCEEIETLTPVDVLRRLGLEVDLIGLTGKKVMGAHNILLTCDKFLDVDLLDYEIVILPGGYTGAKNLSESHVLKNLLNKRFLAKKWNAAMCAAPIAFGKFGLLDECHYTCYPSVYAEIKDDVTNGKYNGNDLVVVDNDKHILTSQGPATALAYSFAIAEILGIDPTKLKADMLYDVLLHNKN